MTDWAWYLVHAKPREEDTALANLERQGYTAFLPRIHATVRRGGRYRRRIEALFPRYLFIELDAAGQDWRPVRSTVGVSRLVCFGTWPAVVPGEIVEGLRRRADDAGIVTAEATADFQPGDSVRIIDGPFAGYEGIVSARNARERVDLLLSLVGQAATARLSAHQLAPS